MAYEVHEVSCWEFLLFLGGRRLDFFPQEVNFKTEFCFNWSNIERVVI